MNKEKFTMMDLLESIEKERNEHKDIQILCDDLSVKIFSTHGDNKDMITKIYKFPVRKLSDLTIYHDVQINNTKLCSCMGPSSYPKGDVINKYADLEDISRYTICVDKGIVTFLLSFNNDNNLYMLKLFNVLLFDYRDMQMYEFTLNDDIRFDRYNRKED